MMDMFSLNKVRDMLPSLPSLSPPPSAEASTHNQTPPEATTGTEAAKNDAEDEEESSSSQISALDPKPIDDSKPKTNLDLINECDSFPYFQTDPELYLRHVNTYYHLRVAAHPDTTLGYMLPSVTVPFRGVPGWDLDDDNRVLTLIAGDDYDSRTAVVANTTAALRELGHFSILKGWRNELYPVYGPGPKKELLFSVERAASALFGITTYGIHMTAYTKSPTTGDLQIWVPRRSATKSTYPGMLDNTVAGGMATGETPLQCCIREAQEEASLPSTLVTSALKSAGTVTYFHIRDSRAGGETKLLQPECQYIFDLEVDADVTPQPCDDEVQEFSLMGVEEVKSRLRKAEFKPNCAVVMLDFFVRHGVLGPEEDGFLEVVSRLHRRLEFPTV